MSVHGKKTIPESWEELEGPTGPSDTIINGPPDQLPKRLVKSATQSTWDDPSVSGEGTIAFVAGQTPYVPQITRILPRPPRPGGGGQPAGPAKDTDNGTVVLTLEEKQRRYAEARRRIFTEEASKR